MDSWILGFDGFIGALTEGGHAVRNSRRGQSIDADSGETGGGYIDIEVEEGLVIQMRKIKGNKDYYAESEQYGGLD
jgi:hypothetical protein